MCRYDAGVEIRTSRSADAYMVDVTADPVRPMVLHWAINEWQPPPPRQLAPRHKSGVPDQPLCSNSAMEHSHSVKRRDIQEGGLVEIDISLVGVCCWVPAMCHGGYCAGSHIVSRLVSAHTCCC